MAKTTKALSFNLETLRELTLDDVTGINGGVGGKVSSMLGPGPQTGVKPTATAVSSVMPPAHHKKHHHH